jgi:hypothetical protein
MGGRSSFQSVAGRRFAERTDLPFLPRYLATDTDAANDIGARSLAASRQPRSGPGYHAISSVS